MIDPSKNIPTASSESQNWVQWHKDLKKVFGKKQANSIWTYAWSKRGGAEAKASTISLRSYMEKQGVKIDKTSLSAIADFSSDVGSFLGGYFTIGKWVGIIAIGVTGVILVKILWGLAKNPNKSIQQIAMLTPQGRAVGGAKAGVKAGVKALGK